MGTAAAAVYAMIEPVRTLDDVKVAAVASRDGDRGRLYTQMHVIPHFSDYDGLLGDASLDAIYVALPNSMHVEWSLKALHAGKAVLNEKPFACNAMEASRAIASAPRYPPLMEALHWRHHPIASRLKQLVEHCELGALRAVDGCFCYPRENLQKGDFRLDYARGGGVLLDAGSYCVNLMRLLLGEPVGVERARTRLWSPEVDAEMKATLRFADGTTGSIVARNDDIGVFNIACVIHCDRGVVTVRNPFLPSFFESRIDLRVKAADGQNRSIPP